MNISELERHINNFYQISGMEIAVLDCHFHQILSAQCMCSHFCHVIHHYPQCTKLCRESDILHLSMVAHTQSFMKYICPFGFHSLIAPVNKEGKTVAYLMCAPGFEEEEGCTEKPVELLLELVPDADISLIQNSINSIPRYSRQTMDAYGDVLMLLAEHMQIQNLVSDDNESIASLTKRYIDSNLNNKITLANLSWKLHSSTVTLTEHFRKEYGISIMTYVIKKRMELAQELLLDSTRTISSVSQACGFSDVEHFSRTFKKQVGLPPSQWRKQAEQA